MNYYAGYQIPNSPIAVFKNKKDRDMWIEDKLKSASTLANQQYPRLKEYEPYYGVKRIPLTYNEAVMIIGDDFEEELKGTFDAFFEQITWYCI